MTIERSTVHCDECPDHLSLDATDFEGRKEEIKAAGWRTFMGPDKKWAHACPDCVRKFARDKR